MAGGRQDKRMVRLRELAWIKLLALLHKSVAPQPANGTAWLWGRVKGALGWSPRPASGGGMRTLLDKAHRTYRERYDMELHGMLQAIVADRSAL